MGRLLPLSKLALGIGADALSLPDCSPALAGPGGCRTEEDAICLHVHHPLCVCKGVGGIANDEADVNVAGDSKRKKGRRENLLGVFSRSGDSLADVQASSGCLALRTRPVGGVFRMLSCVEIRVMGS